MTLKTVYSINQENLQMPEILPAAEVQKKSEQHHVSLVHLRHLQRTKHFHHQLVIIYPKHNHHKHVCQMEDVNPEVKMDER